MKKIVITGGAGYIGSLLATKLLDLGYKVKVIDNLMFEKKSIMHLFSNKNFEFINGDVRNKKIIFKEIKNQDFIIPLAAYVGAPLCDKFPTIAKEINLKSIVSIINNLKKNQKIIFPNTNSGYGIGKTNTYCDEKSPLNPISLYGRTKVHAEKAVLKHKNSIVFRLATVFGYSYRMRTDLLVNFLVKDAVYKKNLNIFEPNFRRNYIHVADVVGAFVFAIKNFNKMKGNIFNIGLSNANLTKLQLANLIKKNIKGTKIKILKNKKDPDKRDYFVSNKKIEKIGFKPKISIEEGIQELKMIYRLNNFQNNKNNY